MRTGCQWNAMPKTFGSSSTVHRYFQERTESGVFEKLWKAALKEYDDLVGIDWRHQGLDLVKVKSPLGGEEMRRKSDGQREIGNETIGHC
jgi:transposase